VCVCVCACVCVGVCVCVCVCVCVYVYMYVCGYLCDPRPLSPVIKLDIRPPKKESV